MTAPSRRRNPVIARGKKSDKKKKKMGDLSRASSTQVDGLTEFLEKADQQRKELFRSGSATSDKGILSEPSTLFYEKTSHIRSKIKGVGGGAILLQKPGFQVGVDVSRVKQERMLVIDGKGSKVFQGLASQFNEQKKNLKQEVRESQLEILERARKREEQNKKVAAEEKEQKRAAEELKRRKIAELLAIEQEKLDSERKAKFELEKQQDLARLKAVELDRLESERLAMIELEEQQEAARIKAIEQEKLESKRFAKVELEKQQEIARLKSIELDRLESEQLAKIVLEKQQKAARIKAIEQKELPYDKDVVRKKKEVFWQRIWSKIRSLFSLKARTLASKDQKPISPSLKPREIEEHAKEVEIETLEEVDEKIKIEEAAVQEEVLVVEEVVERIVEVEPQFIETEEEHAKKDEIDTSEEVDEKIKIEEVAVQEEVLVVEEVEQIDEIQLKVAEIVSLGEIDNVEEVAEYIEEVAVQEEIPVTRGLVEQDIEDESPVIKIEEPPEEVQIETVEEVVEYIEETAVHEAVLVTEHVEKEVVEIEEPVEEVRMETVEEFEEKTAFGDEVLPEIQTGEVMLADLRITMRDEPRPIEFITKILMEKHNLSKRNANIIIDYVASPFSICKTMKDDLFQSFIASLDGETVSSGGVEIWTQVIQIIGLESLSGDQQVEIYNLFMGDEKKVNRKVKTVAILLHFLPTKFNQWWQKEMIPKFVTEKYDSDYKFYQDKKFSEELLEEARMLFCAYAIEKPSPVAKDYTYAKHQAGKLHENQTEEWLKKGGGKIDYITEKNISGWNSKLSGQKYGNKHVVSKITPDILLKKPIQLSVDGQHIHWIDAKKHFIDPALSPEYRVGAFCQQLEKYVGAYGPGLIVWGKNFSEEWNEATKGVVQHIKI